MSEIPAGATVPQDHLKPAAQIEAERAKTVSLTWRGQEFTLPATMEDSAIEVLEAIEDGKAVGMIRGILGDAQYAAFKSKHKPTIADTNDFADAVGKAMGFKTAGE